MSCTEAQRASSYRTRIKTSAPRWASNETFPLKEHLPIEQGLRHGQEDFRTVIHCLKEHLPIKQGLRPTIVQNEDFVWPQRASSYRTRIKTLEPLLEKLHIVLKKHLPIEQGLRQDGFPALTDIRSVSKSIFL